MSSVSNHCHPNEREFEKICGKEEIKEVRIISNGSKWAGEKPDNLSMLYKRLKENTLDPTFEDYGNFFYRLQNGSFTAFGNFLDISHVFNIVGNLKEMLSIAKAIKEAKKKPEYIKAKFELYSKEKKKKCSVRNCQEKVVGEILIFLTVDKPYYINVCQKHLKLRQRTCPDGKQFIKGYPQWRNA